MPVVQVDAVLRTYLERYRTVRQDDSGLFPFLFRNHGASAGASIAHPHSQLIAPDVPPPLIQQEEQAAKARYNELGRCPYCAMVEAELDAEARLVRTNDHFVAFVPFAAKVPYELWIVPREHTPEFGRLTPPRRRALAETLRSVLGRLRTRLDNPDYNLFVRTALDYDPNSPHLHWSLRIRPRTTILAGYEQATGERINPSIPERDAAVLRNDA
jgi:UDPglucose--hexose-1-phosphate uridylyltransferase